MFDKIIKRANAFNVTCPYCGRRIAAFTGISGDYSIIFCSNYCKNMFQNRRVR
jgi:endogenous inhibitor of DNA gyrase (YacG/DUF329 family)